MSAPQRRAFRLGAWLWIGYSAFVVWATTMPFRFTTDEQIVLMKIAHVSPNPLTDPWRGGWVSLAGFVLNIAFFVPFGVLGVVAAGTPEPAALARQVVLVGLLGLLLSLGVETLQVFTRNRIPSSADVLANAIGAIAGAALARHVRGQPDRVPSRARAS